MIGGMFILFLVLLLLNVPIAFSLGASSLFYLLTSNMNAAVLAQKFYAGIDSFTLLCIPGFMLAGALMNGGGITRRILNFCNAFLGHFTGSLALVNIVASMVFAGISGTAIADVCSLGGMLIPAMVEDGYDDDFSVAVTAASSVVGPIIPPSVPMVIAGSCVSISVGKMFQAGIIPGVLLGLALCTHLHYLGQAPLPQARAFQLEEALGSYQRCYLGAADARYPAGRHPFRYLYPHRSFHRDLRLLPDCGRVRL